MDPFSMMGMAGGMMGSLGGGPSTSSASSSGKVDGHATFGAFNVSTDGGGQISNGDSSSGMMLAVAVGLGVFLLMK